MLSENDIGTATLPGFLYLVVVLDAYSRRIVGPFSANATAFACRSMGPRCTGSRLNWSSMRPDEGVFGEDRDGREELLSRPHSPHFQGYAGGKGSNKAQVSDFATPGGPE